MASKKKNISHILNKVVKGILSIANYIGTAFIQVVLWIGEVVFWLIKSLLLLIVSLPSLFKKDKAKRTVFRKASSRSRATNPLLKPFSNKDMRRKLLPGLVVVLLFLAGFAVYNLRQAQETEAHWWDETWLYRRAIDLENPSSTVENAQIKVFDGQDLSTLVTEGKLQESLADLRFTDFNGNLLQYYIEDDTNAAVEAWVLIPSLIEGESVIYMYYGNASATSASSTAWMADLGGEISYFEGYRIHAFLDVGENTYTNFHERNVDVLVVAGGGGGGGRHAAGGGAGGLINEDFSITSSGVVNVSVGSGGVGGASNIAGSNGGNSSFDTVEAVGGGGGGAYSGVRDGSDGGSGGGSTRDFGNGSGIVGQGHDGGLSAASTTPYNHGGGGGAGESGHNGTSNSHGSGGDGLYYGDKYGESYGEDGWFAGGGGGGGHNPEATYQGLGGSGGGGAGGVPGINNPGEDGSANTGSGGGGASTSSGGDSKGGDGGSGIVLVRYKSNVNTPSNITIGSPSVTEEISPGPVAYWKFDEGTGTTAHDSSGQGNHGTFLSAPIWKAEEFCVSGKCLSFDNVDDGVSITNENFTFLTDYTMCSWIAPKGNHKNYTGPIISSGDWNNVHWAFGVNQDNTRIQTRKADGVNSPWWYYTFSLTDWSHTCITRDGATITAYANGQKVGSPYTGTTGNLISNATNTTIGRATYTTYFAFNGLIDEVKVYPYARTAKQIKDDYAAGIAGIGAAKGTTALFGSTKADFKPTDITGNVLWLDATA
ncbi:DUF2341 domain-containing protein, partial [Candidatus Micrarchaeota archaeon]|nr:DUF2341 domain-containing protein [Candidatus Micrarchaeota archaeon]